MTRIFLIGALVFVAILLISKLPFLSSLTSPFISAAGRILYDFMKATFAYVVWFIKQLVMSHVQIVLHLIRPKSHFDHETLMEQFTQED